MSIKTTMSEALTDYCNTCSNWGRKSTGKVCDLQAVVSLASRENFDEPGQRQLEASIWSAMLTISK